MRIATMSVTKIRRPRSSRLRLMRIVLIKVTLELVNFGRNHGWFRKPPMALIRSSMSMIISFSITKWLGKASAARLARGRLGPVGVGYFLQGCLVVIKPEEARSHRMSAVDHSCSGTMRRRASSVEAAQNAARIGHDLRKLGRRAFGGVTRPSDHDGWPGSWVMVVFDQLHRYR
jgi:hypothetical protein